MAPLVPPRLTDGVVVVRERTLDDVDAVTAMCQDPDVQRWTTVPKPYTRDDAVAFHHVAAGLARAGKGLHLLVDCEGRLAAALGVHELDRAAGSAEIGYSSAPWARGRGVTTRAVILLRDWMTGELGLRRLVAYVHRDNAPSHGVALRAGFRDTGELVAVQRIGSTEPVHRVYVWEA